jgi:beta-lactamase class A
MGMRAAAAGVAALAVGIAGGTAGMSAADVPAAAAGTGICTAPAAHKALAVRLSRDITKALAGRRGMHAVTVYDRVTGLTCRLNEGHRFDSASVVKATILAALLRWHQETQRPLSAREQRLATLMITQSDNDAATALWNEVGLARLQHFLDLAKMTETQLNGEGYWGLTQITARDELTLLRLLTKSNSVLSTSSRDYQLRLMARVIPSQRWGVPAGAPRYVTVYVKNGWLPLGDDWHINSIGAFTGHGCDYMMAVLSDGNPSMAYGVATVEAVAEVVHRDLNPGLTAQNALPAANPGPEPSPDVAGPTPPGLS